MPFSSHNIKGTHHQYDWSLLNLTFITWLRSFVRLLHCKVTFFPFSTLHSLEGSYHNAAHTWGVSKLQRLYFPWPAAFCMISSFIPISNLLSFHTVLMCMHYFYVKNKWKSKWSVHSLEMEKCLKIIFNSFHSIKHPSLNPGNSNSHR